MGWLELRVVDVYTVPRSSESRPLTFLPPLSLGKNALSRDRQDFADGALLSRRAAHRVAGTDAGVTDAGWVRTSWA